MVVVVVCFGIAIEHVNLPRVKQLGCADSQHAQADSQHAQEA